MYSDADAAAAAAEGVDTGGDVRVYSYSLYFSCLTPYSHTHSVTSLLARSLALLFHNHHSLADAKRTRQTPILHILLSLSYLSSTPASSSSSSGGRRERVVKVGIRGA